MVDGQPAGKPVQIGLALTSQGWQNLSSVAGGQAIRLPWLTHFASTVLQMPGIAAVVFGRGVGHVPNMNGYTAGLLMWWRGPRGPIYFEEYRQEDAKGRGFGGISL